MLRKFISTAPFRAADRFEAWEAILKEFGVASAPFESTPASFRAEMTLSASSALSHIAFDAANSHVHRSKAEIRRFEWGQYWIYREVGPGARFDFGGREVVTGRGDIMVLDSDAPFQTYANQAYRHDIWMISRTTLDPHLPPLPRPLAVHLPASLDVCVFVAGYLDSVAGLKDGLSDVLSMLVADHIARLIALACGSTSKEHGDALRAAKLARVRRYIEQNLADRNLNPEKAAAALSISVRQLHLTLEASGESFGQYVRRRRLEECRATLENPLAASRSVSDIAFAWGFSSISSFYRAFGEAYSAAPGDLRARSIGVIDPTSGKVLFSGES